MVTNKLMPHALNIKPSPPGLWQDSAILYEDCRVPHPGQGVQRLANRYGETPMKRCMLCCLALFCVWVSPLRSVGQSFNEDLLEMKVKGVTMDPQGNTPVVILVEPQGHRAFPIWIGLPEARAIALALEGVATPRPLTHVLLRNILADLKVEIMRVVITEMQK